MSSGDRAQIEASMLSTEAQKEAFEKSLAFSKEQFAEQKANRRPYMDAGASATQMVVNLLGLNNLTPGVPGGGGGGSYGGGGGTVAPSAASRSGTSGTSGGSSTGGRPGSGGTPTEPLIPPGDVDKFPGYPPYDVKPPGFEQPVPGDRPIIPPGGTPDFDPFDTEGLPPLVPGHSKTSGLINVIDPTGKSRSVPSSLASFYQAKGWRVD